MRLLRMAAVLLLPYCRARKVWSKRPKTYWTKSIDLIIDNKKWGAPTTAAGRNYLRAQKRRFTHRKRSEGMRPEHTKPSKAPKHRRRRKK